MPRRRQAGRGGPGRAGGLGRGRGRQPHDRRLSHREAGRLMFSVYLLLKYIHILAAIVAVGSNITYGVWSVRARRDAAHIGFTLKGIKFLDDRIANPAYGVVLLTGLVMVFAGPWSITSLWIIVALVLFVAGAP